ncbi:(4Fe-4S)-binding protein [Flavivirga amylovorans]|uniref:(4Fe-4S)-binding protein n=1 Tax=Flavivirga amylovorans TaxID=870486 RepID=A0ABT8X4N9_9FLAO|nr:(4Fe-4S)-binding protein [Flavivirga amylovorans]MDO5988924.1 (4Fe-4S)-binding protein [Flavivirga amylovorans]
MKTKDNVFSNSDITVTFDPCACIHSDHCAKELSSVFQDSVIPWIDLEGAPIKKIIEQVKKCPSGALQFHYNKEDKKVA